MLLMKLELFLIFHEKTKVTCLPIIEIAGAIQHQKNNLKIIFFLKYAFISYQYEILSKFEKNIEFRRYFTHGLVLQRKIKAWSLLALGRVYLK